MTTIYVGEYGRSFYVNVDYDLSSATGVAIHFSAPPGGTSFINSTSAEVLAANVSSEACGVFSANKGIEYILNSGDIDAAGTWKAWVEVDFGATVHLISSPFKFKAKNPG